MPLISLIKLKNNEMYKEAL